METKRIGAGLLYPLGYSWILLEILAHSWEHRLPGQFAAQNMMRRKGQLVRNNLDGDHTLPSLSTVMQGCFQRRTCTPQPPCNYHVVPCSYMSWSLFTMLIYHCLWPRTKGFSSNILLWGLPHNLLVLRKLSVFLTLHLVNGMAGHRAGRGKRDLTNASL